MSINAIENLGNPTQAKTGAPSQEALRRAAAQFEAVLLMQLTSSLNGASSDDEDSLFGGDGGSNLAKQMFSEQLATTMADSGGIGLSDIILRQFGGNAPKTPIAAGKLTGVMAAIKDIKGNNTNASAENAAAPVINKNGKIEPLINNFSGDPNDFAVVSTFENEARTEGVDASMRTLELDGRIQNSTRPRVVPNSVSPSEKTNFISTISPTAAVGKVNFQMPLIGRISSNFGIRFHPIDKKMKFHAGIDIAAPKGTPIGASAEGVVTFAGWKKGYGNLVVIQHADGSETRYGHAEKLYVREGDKIAAGQTIAAVGSTGKSTGPHLHFEVRENGQAVDPRRFLSNVLPTNADR